MTCKKLNKLLNKSKPSSKLPKCIINDDGSQISEPKFIANKLNHHFTEKGIKLSSKLPQPTKSIYEYMSPRVVESIPNSNFQARDIIKCINDLKPTRAYDGIPSKVLKWLANILGPLLMKIFNKYLDIGKFPDLFKIAKFTAVHKDGDRKLCENYRPISVLPQLNQVFEKLMHNRLTDFFAKNDLPTKYQYGFRKDILHPMELHI